MANPLTPHEIGQDAWRVEALDLRATLDVAAGRISGESSLRLASAAPAALDQVILRLNPGINLISASEGDQPLTVWQSGMSTSIKLSAATSATVTLHLRWEGTPRLSLSELGQFGTRSPVRGLLSCRVW